VLYGLALNAFGGWRLALSAGAAGLLVLIVGTLPFSLGALGGGDVKLLAACACVLGFTGILPLVFCTALIGGVVALCVLIYRRLARRSERVTVPYACAIAGGVAWLALGDTVLPVLKVTILFPFLKIT
jgi:prepilin peptidase CpaA